MGTEGLIGGPGQARAGGGGPPSSGSPRPPGAPSSLPPPPVCIPRCTCCSPKRSQGPRPVPDAPTPGALLVGEGGAWLTPPASAYSFNFRLLLKGAQSSGLGSLGSPLESAAGGSFSLPHPHLTPTSLGADQYTSEGWRPQLALKCSPRVELGTQCWSLALWGLSFPSGWKSGRGRAR